MRQQANILTYHLKEEKKKRKQSLEQKKRGGRSLNK